MIKTKSYQLASEIDRVLKLDLNYGQYIILTKFLDGCQDSQAAANLLFSGNIENIYSILNTFKK